MNRNFRITPDLMSGATHATLGKPKTATELEWFSYPLAPRQRHLYNSIAYGTGYCRYRDRQWLAGSPGKLQGNHFDNIILDDVISTECDKPSQLSEESLRAALKHFNGIMAVDPAVKNNKKKENKMSRLFNIDPTAPVTIGEARAVEIVPVENGFVIQAGCKTFVSTSWKDAAKALGEYFKDPRAAEKKYCKGGKDGV